MDGPDAVLSIINIPILGSPRRPPDVDIDGRCVASLFRDTRGCELALIPHASSNAFGSSEIVGTRRYDQSLSAASRDVRRDRHVADDQARGALRRDRLPARVTRRAEEIGAKLQDQLRAAQQGAPGVRQAHRAGMGELVEDDCAQRVQGAACLSVDGNVGQSNINDIYRN